MLTLALWFLLGWTLSQIGVNKVKNKPWHSDVYMPIAAVLSFVLVVWLAGQGF